MNRKNSYLPSAIPVTINAVTAIQPQNNKTIFVHMPHRWWCNFSANGKPNVLMKLYEEFEHFAWAHNTKPTSILATDDHRKCANYTYGYMEGIYIINKNSVYLQNANIHTPTLYTVCRPKSRLILLDFTSNKDDNVKWVVTLTNVFIRC